MLTWLGCDSVLVTELIVLPTFATSITVEICDDETYVAGGAAQNTSGAYIDTLTAINGCDSVLTTNLIVHPTYLTNLQAEICDGESILLGGAQQTISGIYYDTLQSVNSCDSVLATELIVHSVYEVNVQTAICDGESILLGGAQQTTGGTYIDTLNTIEGCDSVILTELTILP